MPECQTAWKRLYRGGLGFGYNCLLSDFTSPPPTCDHSSEMNKEWNCPTAALREERKEQKSKKGDKGDLDLQASINQSSVCLPLRSDHHYQGSLCHSLYKAHSDEQKAQRCLPQEHLSIKCKHISYVSLFRQFMVHVAPVGSGA